MLKPLNGIRLVRFEPQYHTAKAYEWYYSGDYPEFFRNWPACPDLMEIMESSKGKSFVIVRDVDGVIMGSTSIYGENECARNFSVGLMVDKAFEGQGAAKIALQILLNWKFNYCNFYKAKFNVMARNRRVCGSLEKFGAQREGGKEATLKKEYFLNGEFHDGAVYALFKSDFNKHHKKFFEPEETRLEAPFPTLGVNGHGQPSIGIVSNPF